MEGQTSSKDLEKLADPDCAMRVIVQKLAERFSLSVLCTIQQNLQGFCSQDCVYSSRELDDYLKKFPVGSLIVLSQCLKEKKLTTTDVSDLGLEKVITLVSVTYWTTAGPQEFLYRNFHSLLLDQLITIQKAKQLNLDQLQCLIKYPAVREAWRAGFIKDSNLTGAIVRSGV